MDYVDQVKHIIEMFKELASLQKADLESTAEMPNYVASFTQILKLKIMFINHSDQALIVEKINNLLKGSLAEMKGELPKMIAVEYQEAAFDIYEQIKKKFGLITTSLNELSRLAAKKSCI